MNSHPVGIDYLCFGELHPLEQVEAAAKAGANRLGLMPSQMKILGDDAAPFSLVDDAALRRDMISCARDNGIAFGLGDGLPFAPGTQAEDYARVLDAYAEMGVRIVNTVTFDTIESSIPRFARLADMAQRRGMRLLLEACPILSVETLAQALDVVRRVAHPHFGLLIDTMHLCRTGEAADLAAVDPALIGYVQISDGPLAMPPSREEYGAEALYDRAIPGEGEMPLAQILRHIPDDVIVSGEVPLRRLREAGIPATERVRRIITGIRQQLDLASMTE